MDKLNYNNMFPVSVYEAYVKLYEKMNELINQSNELVIDTDKKLELMKQILDDGLEGIKPEINNQLYELINNGTIEEIINTNIFNDLNSQIKDIENKSIKEINLRDYLTGVETDEQFGAKLNGIDDDTEYIKKCHEFANLHGLKVMQNNKDIVISDSIDVMTDLNLNGCNVMVNITDVNDGSNRVKNVFNIKGKEIC